MNDIKKYHIQMTFKDAKPPHKRLEWDYDLSYDELERRYLAPYRRGRPTTINGRSVLWKETHRTRVYWTERNIRNLARIPWDIMNNVTDEHITNFPGWELEAAPSTKQQPKPMEGIREVFVVHGKNDVARDALFDFLRAIDLHPLEWSEVASLTGRPSPYIGEILKAAFSHAHAVVVLFTPDDEARLRQPYRAKTDPPHETQLTGQARPNVLFEAGMAMGRDENRTVLVELGTLRPFSDMAGRHVIRMDNSSQRRQELAQRLIAAGCPVNLDGTDWHSAGDFESAIELLDEEKASPVANETQSTPIDEESLLSEDAKELLIEAADPNGRILKTRSLAGVKVQTNSRQFVEIGNRRSEARWEQAIEDLFEEGLIDDPAGTGSVFKLTHRGFQLVDSLTKQG